MTRYQVSLFAVMALALAACPTKKTGPIEPKDPARPQPVDPTGPTAPTGPVMPSPPTSPSTGELQAPVLVELSGPERVAAGDRIEVVLRIRRAAPNALPMELGVSIPAGASVRDSTIAPTMIDATAELIERRIQLEIDRVPVEDLVITLDQRAPDYGAHATAHYRFGRPEPRLPAPRRAGDHSLGRPVLLGNP